ncbi:MAG TPA: flagellin [Dongiaceae bacterium]|jgi:flagellin-like hook-associated protein FlgL|nr:flagellin [Dongiaceae bacterium]
MPTNDIQLTAGIRTNLLLLQVTSEKIDRTQQRLATGNKINAAIDGAVAFFSSKGLNRRADDLSQLKDSIGQSISTIKGADTGVTAIEGMLDQAKGLITSAYGSLGKDKASVDLRKSLSEQFNNLLRQVDKLADDANYQGKNLLLGSGLRLDATSSSKSATNAITGVSNARVTNVVSADDYVIDIGGDGAISANASDIANAERDRGIQNLTIGGFASKTLGNFEDVVIKYAGGKGKDKTFTITEGSVAITKTFTVAQWNNAKATGHLLNFDHQFASGTHINFDVDFDEIDDVPDTAGVGTSVIEKNVNIEVAATNLNGIGQRIERSALNLSGQQKLDGGENSFAFDSGTPRLTVDERTILQAAAYSATIGSAYGRASDAIVGTPTIPTTPAASTGIANDFTYSLLASATAADFDFVTGTFASYAATLIGPNGGVTTTVSVSGSYAFSSAADAGQNVTLNLQTAGFQGIVRATASSAGAANATEQALGAALPATGVSLSALSGLADNLAHTLTFDVSTNGSASTINLSDGYGGTATVTGTLGSQVLAFTITGGVNSGATVTLTLTSGGLVANSEGTVRYNAIGDFTAPDQALFDARAANTGQASTLTTVQVTDGNDSNNLTVQLNETNTSQVTVVSQNVKTDGQGLAVDFAQNEWRDRADIDSAAAAIEAAKLRLRGAASALSNNLDIITTRLNYTNEFINVLAEGANKLVQADQNEEGANLLQLQTRQQLGTISLSLANQAQQAILRLF